MYNSVMIKRKVLIDSSKFIDGIICLIHLFASSPAC